MPTKTESPLSAGVRNHLSLVWDVRIQTGPKATGHLDRPGLSFYSPAVPVFPNGVARLSFTGSAKGGLLRLEMSDRESPTEAVWYPVAASLVENEQGDLQASIPAHINKSDYAPTPRWIRAYYGAHTPVNQLLARLASERGHTYEPEPLAPHTVTLHLDYREDN